MPLQYKCQSMQCQGQCHYDNRPRQMWRCQHHCNETAKAKAINAVPWPTPRPIQQFNNCYKAKMTMPVGMHHFSTFILGSLETCPNRSCLRQKLNEFESNSLMLFNFFPSNYYCLYKSTVSF
jgi:hypothetical protein